MPGEFQLHHIALTIWANATFRSSSSQTPPSPLGSIYQVQLKFPGIEESILQASESGKFAKLSILPANFGPLHWKSVCIQMFFLIVFLPCSSLPLPGLLLPKKCNHVFFGFSLHKYLWIFLSFYNQGVSKSTGVKIKQKQLMVFGKRELGILSHIQVW